MAKCQNFANFGNFYSLLDHEYGRSMKKLSKNFFLERWFLEFVIQKKSPSGHHLSLKASLS